MSKSQEDIKLIFGMKLKKLRTDKGFSLQELSIKSGISISYLNEIEKGKKYPKTDKIADLADALEISYDQLVSLKLQKTLTTVSQILNFELINSLPFDTFGIDKKVIMNMIAEEPIKIAAFFNTIIELARNYNLKLDHFYFTMLRSYLELNGNYFENIESAVLDYKKEHFTNAKRISTSLLKNHLEAFYLYKIKETDFSGFNKLKGFRSVFFPDIKPRLFYNSKLNEQQQLFLFGREIGFNGLKLDKRPHTTSWLKVDSFDHVLNNVFASYFSQALIIDKTSLIEDVKLIFSKRKWSDTLISNLLDKYDCSSEMLFQRLSNILPKYFGANDLFFIRYSSKDSDKHLKEISKEIHLTKQVGNLQHLFAEQAYRRSITKKMVTYLAEKAQTDYSDTLIEAIIHENEFNHKYLIISILRKMPELSHKANSVTIGFLLTDSLKQKISFWEDSTLSQSKLNEIIKKEPETFIENKRIQELTEKEIDLERLKLAAFEDKVD